MAALQELVKQVADSALRARLEAEVARLQKQRKFGLVYEDHLPEATPMPGVTIRPGMTVATRRQDGGALYRVVSVANGQATCLEEATGAENLVFPLADLVAVARFGEPIYPTLEPIDQLEHGGGDLWHALIQADNYHALQLLEYLYAGKFDCIYIDPPYNTGAKDWKYNNDYVDSSDAYRHSKWLSMMEKRLAIAKRLLNPKDSVLIVTIDEKEYLHLGMLLEQMFPEARIQMVNDVINPHGANRKDMFARVEECIYFVFFGTAKVCHTNCDMLNPVVKRDVPWQHLIRGGSSGKRAARPNQFYPIFFRISDGSYHSVGKSLPLEMPREQAPVPEGCFAVYPINTKNGTESIWGVYPESFDERQKKGYIQFGPYRRDKLTRSISFLQTGTIERIENGEIEVVGKNADGTLLFGNANLTIRPLSVWNQTNHSASEYGSSLLNRIFPNLRFSFPKSLYSTHDAIRFAVANKPNALILDFFAGSGTTLHAVNLLNAEDGGHRRCILVTNNEVSNDEAAAFRKAGLRPGDAAWEARGIAQYVTWPRTTCSIRGVNVRGEPLKGEYITAKGGALGERALPMAEGFRANAAFFKLGFTDVAAVSLGRRFRELLPVLWMKAGCHGACPDVKATDDFLVLPENRMAFLFDEAAFAAFRAAVRKAGTVETVFAMTDYESSYRAVVRAFPHMKVHRLYGEYLDAFRLNAMRSR